MLSSPIFYRLPKLIAGGALCEMARLDGARNGLSDADFEKFVESFPIEPV